jgi:TRAF3-interacting protein 1
MIKFGKQKDQFESALEGEDWLVPESSDVTSVRAPLGWSLGHGQRMGSQSGSKEWVERTRIELQTGKDALISKPRLTDKLLERPPFKLLHDVFTRVQAATNFAPGLFSEAEADRDQLTDKQSKLNWLKKAIGCVERTINEDLGVKSEKVVAGKEPEKTNVFLRALAKAARQGECTDADKDAFKQPGKSHERDDQIHREEEEVQPAGDAKEAREGEIAPDQGKLDPGVDQQVWHECSAASQQREAAAGARSSVLQEEEHPEHQEQKRSNQLQEEIKAVVEDQEERFTRGTTSQPRSARKVPPRPCLSIGRSKSKQQHGQQIQSEEQLQKFLGTIISCDDDNDDEGDVVIADESELATQHKKDESTGGKLVHEIQAANEKALSTSEHHSNQQEQVQVSSGQGIVLQRRGKKGKPKEQSQQQNAPWIGAIEQNQIQRESSTGSSGKDIGKVKDAVQRLVCVFKPFGQAIEHLSQDAEAMDHEREQWRQEFKKAERDDQQFHRIHEQQDHDRGDTEEQEIKELQQRIKEELAAVRSAKARSLRNEERIADLVRIVTSPEAATPAAR